MGTSVQTLLFFCYDQFNREPGQCKRGHRCSPSPGCEYARNPNLKQRVPEGKGKEYKCIANINEISEEDCAYALPCDLGGETPIMLPNQEECRLHKDGSKCQLVDCLKSGFKNETNPVTVVEAKNQNWNTFAIVPYYCIHKSFDFDCNTAIPCMKDSHDKENEVLDEMDESKCGFHHTCRRTDECLAVTVSFGDHIDVMPGLFHKHQASGHKIIYLKPNRCVPKNNLLDPNDLSRKDQLCKTELGCSTDADCGEDQLTCQIDTCPFYVLHKKKGVPDFEHPFDHAHMKGKFINFVFEKESIDVVDP